MTINFSSAYVGVARSILMKMIQIVNQDFNLPRLERKIKLEVSANRLFVFDPFNQWMRYPV
jgi:hypothetical protein